MFLGEFRHTLDEAGRLVLPAEFRSALQDGAYLVLGLDDNLMLLPPERFQALYRQLLGLSLTDPVARQLRRLMFAAATQVRLDASGRIRLPAALRQRAHLEREVVVVGVGDYIELWEPSRWAAQQHLLDDPEARAQRFAVFHVVLSEPLSKSDGDGRS